MEIEYNYADWNGKEKQGMESIPDFVYKEVIYMEEHHAGWNWWRREIDLQDQPKKVLDVLSRLLSFLLEKNLMTFDEFHDIVDSSGSMRSNTILKREDR